MPRSNASQLKLSPSILAADFSRLGEEISAVEQGGAHQIHIDVLDGHFAPNLSMGPMVVETIRKVTRLPFDVHLMVTDADSFIEPFAEAGADNLTVHIEACTHIHRTLTRIKALNLRAGVAINPGTSLNVLDAVLENVDIILIMSVNPGFGGQAFIPASLKRLAQMRERIEVLGLPIDLGVDGGISLENAAQVAAAGANVITAGSTVFNAPQGARAAVEALLNRLTP